MKTDSITISVIVPVYNMAGLMRRALDRLASQSYRDYEVILVDDGSTDGSGEVCDEYSAMYPNFRTIHKKNGGCSSARNAGLSVANGEWVTFCDSDDLPSEDWLANYAVDSAGDAELVIQGFEADKADFGPNRDSRSVGFDYMGDAVEFTNLVIRYNVIGYTWCKLYRSEIIRTHSLCFDVNVRLREDEIFLLHYLPYVHKAISRKEKGYFYFVPEWGNKYGLSFEDECYLNDSADIAIKKLLMCGDFHVLRDFYIDSRNYNMMIEFSKTRERKYLKQVRGLILQHPDSTRLSSYLKTIIRFDGTMTLSWVALLCHMKLKKALGK